MREDFILWLTFVGFGIGVLMPWFSLVSTFDYMTATMGTRQPASVYPFALQLPAIATYFWAILNAHKPSSYTKRIVSTFFINAALMITMPFLISLSSTGLNFWACLVTIAVIGVVMGLNNYSLFSLAAELGPYYMAGLFLGQGLGAIFLNLLRVGTLKAWPANQMSGGLFVSTLVFYSIVAFFLTLFGISHLAQRDKIETLRQLSKSEGTAINDDKESFERMANEPLVESEQIITERKQMTYQDLFDVISKNLKQTEGLLYSMIGVLFITLTVYPGLAFNMSLNFMQNVPNASAWTLILVQVGFNVFDTVGRWFAGMTAFDLGIRTIHVCAVLRVLFVLTFLAVALQWPPAALFGADWFKLGNIALMSFSNGYISSLCGIKAPSTVQDENERAQVGGYIGLCIQIGVLSGTLMASAFAPILKANTAT